MHLTLLLSSSSHQNTLNLTFHKRANHAFPEVLNYFLSLKASLKILYCYSFTSEKVNLSTTNCSTKCSLKVKGWRLFLFRSKIFFSLWRHFQRHMFQKEGRRAPECLIMFFTITCNTQTKTNRLYEDALICDYLYFTKTWPKLTKLK